jgi:hypothetical protein
LENEPFAQAMQTVFRLRSAPSRGKFSRAHCGFEIRRQHRRDSPTPPLAATWMRASDCFELTAGPAVAVSKRRGLKIDQQIPRTGLSTVTLEPLRPRTAHVVALRSIAAVRQDGSDGPQNGHEIHSRLPHPVVPAHVVGATFGQDMDVMGQLCGMRGALGPAEPGKAAATVTGFVMPGLDPGIHLHCKKAFAKGMDCRVKPGNDRD